MNTVKIRGIVLRDAPMGEKDKRLVILSGDRGKLTAVAKGALSPKSKWKALAQPFCCADFVLAKGKTFYYVQEGTLLSSFYGLRESLEKLTYGTFCLEIAELFSPEGAESVSQQKLLLRLLTRLEKEIESKARALCAVFIFRMLSDNGFAPSVESCARCGALLEGKAATFFPESGLAVCQNCEAARDGARGGYHAGGFFLSPGALRAVSYAESAEEEKVFSFAVSREVENELCSAAEAYLQAQTDHHFRSLDFLRKIQ